MEWAISSVGGVLKINGIAVVLGESGKGVVDVLKAYISIGL